ncbi:galanin receptor 2b-like [Saccoglossus kowalevskii]|uniref:Neuropeptide FF receptor 2-like n=1 Tax=Saccoglossus kowalevskii TaxID=10224 RepID=A0ABM0MWZ4_SACKO|nr:PREDICTED: neuropeptide FF receptor 2-like [Saccoglossus kowalevskii]
METNTTHDTSEGASHAEVAIYCLTITITCFGIIGNTMVCAIVSSTRELHTYTNMFIVHQAVIDLLGSIILLLDNVLARPVEVAGYLLPAVYCKLWVSRYFYWTNLVASTFNLVLITFERYVAIVYPLRYVSIYTNTTVIIMIMSAWVLASVYKSYVSVFRYVKDGICYSNWSKLDPHLQTFIGVMAFLVEYFVPVMVISLAYIHIAVVLKRSATVNVGGTSRVGQTGGRSAEGCNEKSASMLRARNNVLKILLLVVLAYVICWSPNQFLFLKYNLTSEYDFQSVFYHFTVLLAFCNLCVNPVIYALKYKKFRKPLKRMYLWCRGIQVVESELTEYT